MKTNFRLTAEACSRLGAMAVCILVLCLAGCSPVKHVPDGELLLDKVTIKVHPDSADMNGPIEEVELYNFLRQQPNHKVLGFAKL